MIKFTSLFGLFVIFFQFSLAQNGIEPILVTDMLQIKRVDQLELSPDKRQLLFNMQSIVENDNDPENYRYDHQLWISDIAAGTMRQLTYGADNPSGAVYSPDGNSILFVRQVDGKPQLFLLLMSGGEPRQLTDFKYGANSPKWSPDGKKILFSAAIRMEDMFWDSLLNPDHRFPAWASEKPGFANNSYLKPTEDKGDPNGSLGEIRAYLVQNEKEHKAKVINKLQFQSETGTFSELQFNHWFVMDLKELKPQVVTTGFNSYAEPYFIDNARLLVTAKPGDAVFPDRVLESAILEINLLNKTIKTILATPGKAYRINSVSPSGKYLIYSESTVGIPQVAKVKLMHLEQHRELYTVALDRNMNDFKWADNEESFYFLAESRGGVPLFRFALKDGHLEKLSSEDIGLTDYVIGRKSLIYAKTSVANPCELELADADMKNAKTISTFNSPWLASKKISFPEKHTFTNDEGMEVDYWIMKPTNYQDGKQYPLLLEIHGGPTAMWGPGEASMWHEYQFFCGKGYGIVYSNPRGSGGYGDSFLKANINNWGEGPTKDVLGALDRTVAEGWADTSKLLITGGSYAGYLVSWIIGHDQRFKAACSQRGVYDLKTFFGEGNAWRLVPNYFGGYPWQDDARKIIERESPINYVENIKTPYIIFHGENDLRTGTVQGEMLYKSLKVLGRPVEYVRHPGATHEITRSGDNRQRIDQMLRTYEFFERFIN